MKIDLDFKEVLLEKLKNEGLDQIGVFVAGGLGKKYIDLDIGDSDDDDNRRTRIPKSKLGLVLRKAVAFAASAAKKTNWVQEQVGELMTYVVTEAIGFKGSGLGWSPSNHGPDIMAYHEGLGMWGIFEAKGGTSKLSRKPASTYGGTPQNPATQMNHQWIKYWYQRVGELNQLIAPLGTLLYPDSVAQRNLLAMVVTQNLNLEKDHLRAGFQTWTSSVSAWNKWQDTPKKWDL